jgi:hypothetical protein
MSRSGYSDDCEGWELICWRGAVASAIRGRRGQAFLREMLAALDALPVKRLINGELEAHGEVCALGAVGVQRSMSNLSEIDAYDRDKVSATFGIPPALAAEIMFENDEGGGYWSEETPERRYDRVRRWVKKQHQGGRKIVTPSKRPCRWCRARRPAGFLPCANLNDRSRCQFYREEEP